MSDFRTEYIVNGPGAVEQIEVAPSYGIIFVTAYTPNEDGIDPVEFEDDDPESVL